MFDSFYVRVPRKKYFAIDWPFYICYAILLILGVVLLIRAIIFSSQYNNPMYFSVGIMVSILFILSSIGISVAFFLLRPAGLLLIEITANGTIVLTPRKTPPQSFKLTRVETRKDGWIAVIGTWRNKVLLPPLDEEGKETAKHLKNALYDFD